MAQKSEGIFSVRGLTQSHLVVGHPPRTRARYGVSIRHAIILVLCSAWLFPVPGISGRTSSSQANASANHHASPPLTVVSTDELYKPALLKDGRLIATAVPATDAEQRVVAIYSGDNGHTWSEPSPLFSLPRDEGTFGYYDYFVDEVRHGFQHAADPLFLIEAGNDHGDALSFIHAGMMGACGY